MSVNTKKAKKIIIKDEGADVPIEKEVQGVMNAVKGDQLENGNIPNTGSIVINAFAGKKLGREKSVVFKGKQYFLKKGIAWEDVDNFFKKHMSFSSKDFK